MLTRGALRAKANGQESRNVGQDGVDHLSRRVDEHAAIGNWLIEAAASVCDRGGVRPEIAVLRGGLIGASRKIHAREAGAKQLTRLTY